MAQYTDKEWELDWETLLNYINLSLACPARHMDVAVFKSEQTGGQKNRVEIQTLPIQI